MPVRRMWRRPVTALIGFVILLATQALGNDHASEARMGRDITFLASDECEGRGPGTKGIDKAADYIANEFQQAGLKPGGLKGSYFQPFQVYGQARLGQANSLRLRGPLGEEIELRLGVDFQVMGLSGSGKVSAPVVFAGYGATAPRINFDDYKGIDVTGKVVVVLRRTPRWGNDHVPFDGDRQEEHAGLETKIGLAEANRAAALILVNDRSELAGGDKLMSFGYLAGLSNPGIPALHLRRAVIEPVFLSSLGRELRDLEQAIDRDLKSPGAVLSGWTATLETKVERPRIAVKNIVGVAEGSGPLARETVVVGAHYDHLGYGGPFSRAKDQKKKEIHHGADDNGSGTTALLELARRFGRMSSRQGRRLVFIAFSAEEMGLLGSRHYCKKEPLFPLTDTVAMVNLDMVGRLSQDPKTKKDKLIVEGTGTAKGFDKLIDRLNGNPDFQLIKKPGGTGPSDHDSFYHEKVPVFFFWTGMHADYHRPSDTSDKINVPGMRRITDLAEKVAGHLASAKDRPEYVRIASSFKATGGRIPRLGFMPNYETEKEGVLIGGVSDGGPAAKAGIKVGDQIVELGGRPVKNLSTYMVLIRQHQAGQAVELGILRNGKKLSLKVIPQ